VTPVSGSRALWASWTYFVPFAVTVRMYIVPAFYIQTVDKANPNIPLVVTTHFPAVTTPKHRNRPSLGIANLRCAHELYNGRVDHACNRQSGGPLLGILGGECFGCFSNREGGTLYPHRPGDQATLGGHREFAPLGDQGWLWH